MVNLYISKNVVSLSKREPTYKLFISKYLTKYEDKKVVDIYNSTKTKKIFKTIKEIRRLYTETKDTIFFPRGVLELIPVNEYQIIDESPEDYLKTPQLSSDEIKKTLSVFDLREDQIIAVNKCLLCKRGVIQLPTAVGKSAIITATIKRLVEVNPDMKSLVIAPTLSTVRNIHDALIENGLDSSIYGHPNKDVSHSITTGLVQSLISNEDPKLLYGINAVFYDECLPGRSMILLPDGSHKSIKEIYEDDSIQEVLSYNLTNNTYEIKKILRKIKSPYNQKFSKIYYKDPLDLKIKGLMCTPNHKVYVVNKNDYIPTEEIEPGDYLKIDYPSIRLFNNLWRLGIAEVTKIYKGTGSTVPYKYNLEVEGNHNYFADNVLVSNCHHLKCETWNKLNLMLPNVEYALGFSALSINKDEIFETDFSKISYDSSLIIGSSGRVLMHMDPSYYIEKGIIALPVVLRVNNYHSFISRGFDESQWHQVSKLGLMSSDRTDKISKIAKIFTKYNRRILILVSEKDYAFKIGEFLIKEGLTSFGISFGAGKGYLCTGSHLNEDSELVADYEKEDSIKVMNKLSTDEISVLIGSSHLDEGVNIKQLDAIILSSGGKVDRRIIQRLGRVLRKSKSGKYAYIIDFVDSGSRVLSRQSNIRYNLYRKEIGVPKENLFNGIEVDQIEAKFKELEDLN